MTTVHFVRHGQSTWNAAGRLQGQRPGPELTPLGHEQARHAGRALEQVRVDAVVSSDLLRAVQTAEAVAAGFRLPVRLCRGWRERGYGTLEGHPSQRAAELAGDIDWLDPDVRPGGGESLRDVHTRVGTALARCVAEHPDGAVVVVSHGDTIRVALASVAGLGPHEIPWADVPNGSVTSVEVTSIEASSVEVSSPSAAAAAPPRRRRAP